MAGHALRGMVTAWLGLVVLQTVSTKGGSGRLASMFGDVDHLIQRAFSPTVAAIPDRRNGAPKLSAAKPIEQVATGGTTPGVPTSPLLPRGGSGGTNKAI
jgi:hypothetical protein